MINLNKPTVDDRMAVSHSRAVATPKRVLPAPVKHPVHSMCLAMSEVYRYEPTMSGMEPVKCTWKREGSTVTVTGVVETEAAALATSLPYDPATETRADGVTRQQAEEHAEAWHDELPPVPGVYITRLLEPGGRTGPRWFDGTFYHSLGGNGIDPRKCMSYGNNRDVQWSRLIEADACATS